MSAAGIKGLWTGTPWTLRIYVVLGVVGQLWCSIAYQTVYSAVAALILGGVSYLLLKGTRWTWIAMVVLTSLYFVLFLLAWWVVAALSYLIPLALLLAPPTRRHFAQERSASPAVSESRVGRLRASPLALRAFAVGLFAWAVGALVLAIGDRLDEKPGQVVLTFVLAIVIYGGIGYFVVRGGRVMWSIAIALMSAVVVVAVAGGRWPVAVVPAALLVLLLLPASVAFVWRDRRQPAV